MSTLMLGQVPAHLHLSEVPEEREHMETEIISECIEHYENRENTIDTEWSRLSFCVVLETLITSYFDIVRKNFLDMVPKTIMCFLVNQAKGEPCNVLIIGFDGNFSPCRVS